MRKIIKVNLSTQSKVQLLSLIAGIELSKTESAILSTLIECSSNGTITLSAQFNRQICQELKIEIGNYNVSIHRLTDKKAINRTGKNLILNPIYKDLIETTEVVIKIS